MVRKHCLIRVFYCSSRERPLGRGQVRRKVCQLSAQRGRVEVRGDRQVQGEQLTAPPPHNGIVARYREYTDLPEHIREMLRLVTSGEDDAAEHQAIAHTRGGALSLAERGAGDGAPRCRGGAVGCRDGRSRR